MQAGGGYSKVSANEPCNEPLIPKNLCIEDGMTVNQLLNQFVHTTREEAYTSIVCVIYDESVKRGACNIAECSSRWRLKVALEEREKLLTNAQGLGVAKKSAYFYRKYKL